MKQPLDKPTRIRMTEETYRKSPDPPVIATELMRENIRLLRFLIPEGASVLDIGCGTGGPLAALKPSRGLGIDYAAPAIETARERHPHLEFRVADAEEFLPEGETFDFVLINIAVGDFLDVWRVFRNLRGFCRPETRVVITYYNFVWDPAVTLAQRLGMTRQRFTQNWLSLTDIQTLLSLNGFEIVQSGRQTLFPLPVPLVAPFFNRGLSKLPLLNHLGLFMYCVARPAGGEPERRENRPSVSIVIPTRNERGNIESAVARTADFAPETELLFVDGNSTDGTVEEIERQIELHRGKRNIRLLHQVPRGIDAEKGKMLKLGKGDAVRKGFAAASGDILMILDSDLTVPPEDMEKFYLALAEDRAEFINGNRLSYPMEQEAMRFLNLVANRVFGLLFTWLLNQRVKDTLCGTKALTRRAYETIAANRAYFGDFDPFGDFDLLFGAAKQNLKIIDLPVRYRARTYGDIKIERFKHGLLLLKMCWFAFKRFKLQ